ncbi:hypothetical protein ABW21_db0203199 [Orbilia brochopaga]|nr:hypothetical protein ABW21_db0203199 [Drechslerella brochopaga]
MSGGPFGQRGARCCALCGSEIWVWSPFLFQPHYHFPLPCSPTHPPKAILCRLSSHQDVSNAPPSPRPIPCNRPDSQLGRFEHPGICILSCSSWKTDAKGKGQ